MAEEGAVVDFLAEAAPQEAAALEVHLIHFPRELILMLIFPNQAAEADSLSHLGPLIRYWVLQFPPFARPQFPITDQKTVIEMGSFMHACEGEIVCQSINAKIPYFNAPIYLQNKSQIGKVDEILGPLNQVYFTIKPQEGIVAASFKEGDKFYIGGDKLLPVER